MAPGDTMTRRRLAPPRPAQARGFAYLWLLFFVAAMGVALAAGGVVWEVRVRREKERDLLAIGAEMRRAIADYYRFTPQAAKELPQRLEDLLEDRRGPAPRRHLRRVYADPLTGGSQWGLVLLQGRILGVYSLAPGTPVMRGGFHEADQAFTGALRYADWRFVAPDVPVPAVPAAPASTAPSSPAQSARNLSPTSPPRPTSQPASDGPADAAQLQSSAAPER
jgi:hypothetical protein